MTFFLYYVVVVVVVFWSISKKKKEKVITIIFEAGFSVFSSPSPSSQSPKVGTARERESFVVVDMKKKNHEREGKEKYCDKIYGWGDLTSLEEGKKEKVVRT